MTEREAAETSGTAGRGRKPGPKMSAARQALRNAAIIEALQGGAEVREVAKRHEITQRRVRQIREGFELRTTALDETPMEIIERVLRRLERQMENFATVAEDTIDRAPAVAVGAMKGYVDVLERYYDLLGGIGKLPDNLELFRAETEMLRIGQSMVDKLQELEQGLVTPREVQEHWAALINMPSRGSLELAAGDVVEGGEAA